jgi:hypothetical protein
MTKILSPKLISEFCGFFLAEGYAGIVQYKQKNRDSLFFRPQLTITQRADNRELLQQIKDNFGGHLYSGMPRHQQNGFLTQATIVWICINISEINQLCSLFLGSKLKAKKLQSIKILKKFIDWKIKRGIYRHYSQQDIQKILNWKSQIQKNNQFGFKERSTISD